MKNTSIIIAISILVILSSIAIAYKEEIKEISNEAIQNYIISQIKELSESQQQEFESFKELKIEDKFLRAWELNNKNNEADS